MNSNLQSTVAALRAAVSDSAHERRIRKKSLISIDTDIIVSQAFPWVEVLEAAKDSSSFSDHPALRRLLVSSSLFSGGEKEFYICPSYEEELTNQLINKSDNQKMGGYQEACNVLKGKLPDGFGMPIPVTETNSQKMIENLNSLRKLMRGKIAGTPQFMHCINLLESNPESQITRVKKRISYGLFDDMKQDDQFLAVHRYFEQAFKQHKAYALKELGNSIPKNAKADLSSLAVLFCASELRRPGNPRLLFISGTPWIEDLLTQESLAHALIDDNTVSLLDDIRSPFRSGLYVLMRSGHKSLSFYEKTSFSGLGALLFVVEQLSKKTSKDGFLRELAIHQSTLGPIAEFIRGDLETRLSTRSVFIAQGQNYRIFKDYLSGLGQIAKEKLESEANELEKNQNYAIQYTALIENRRESVEEYYRKLIANSYWINANDSKSVTSEIDLNFTSDGASIFASESFLDLIILITGENPDEILGRWYAILSELTTETNTLEDFEQIAWIAEQDMYAHVADPTDFAVLSALLITLDEQDHVLKLISYIDKMRPQSFPQEHNAIALIKLWAKSAISREAKDIDQYRNLAKQFMKAMVAPVKKTPESQRTRISLAVIATFAMWERIFSIGQYDSHSNALLNEAAVCMEEEWESVSRAAASTHAHALHLIVRCGWLCNAILGNQDGAIRWLKRQGAINIEHKVYLYGFSKEIDTIRCLVGDWKVAVVYKGTEFAIFSEDVTTWPHIKGLNDVWDADGVNNSKLLNGILDLQIYPVLNSGMVSSSALSRRKEIYSIAREHVQNKSRDD